MSYVLLILAFTMLSPFAFAERLPDADALFAPVDMNQVRFGTDVILRAYSKWQ